MLQVLININSILSIIFIILVVFFEKKKPESTLAWVLILFFVPYVGVFLYIIFGDLFRFNIHKKERDKILNDKDYFENIKNQIDYLQSDVNFRKNFKWADLILMNSNTARSLTTMDNEIVMFNKASDKYDRLFEDLKNARESINISYYIIKKDFYGKMLLDILVEKVKEGVEVRLIYDHIGSKITSKKFFKPLIDVGGKVEKFFPSRIALKLYINHRNHRKMVVIDGKIGYLGGMNIGKEYTGADKKISPWCDKHIRVVGGAVNSIQTQFFLDYLFVSKEKIMWADPNILNKFYKFDKNPKGNNIMQIIASGPDYQTSNIRNNYLKMINEAKESIIIETPYLILDESINTSLKLAAKSGVDVKIVIPSVPDKKIIYLATKSFARDLMECGVKIYAYKGFMHSKIVIADDIVSIGSANMDRRSFSLNFEINANIYNKEFNETVRDMIDRELDDCVLLDKNSFKANIFMKILEKLIVLFAPII